MIKYWLEKQIVFDTTLNFLALLAEWNISENMILFFTEKLAEININLNNPKKTDSLSELARTWKNLMPADGQENFKITGIEGDTAYAEIHLHCPLRGTGKVETCYKFMNIDRSLMKEVGGSLTVLESQSNSGKPYCKLAIRKVGSTTDDLIPAHKKK
jgi:hypothetical protein